MNAKNDSKNWVIVSLLAVTLPVVLFLVLDSLYGGSESGVRAYGVLSAGLVIISLITLVFAAIAFFNLKGKAKLLSIGGILISLFIMCISAFTAAMSVFAANH